MHRGILLSSDIRSVRFPWAPFLTHERLQAPALSDPVWQFVPWLGLARRELAAGRVPLWNPHQDGGVPLLGNAQSALLTPLDWPVLALGTARAWNLSLLARLLLAAAGAYLLLRDVGRSRAAAALGAVAFSSSGAFIAWLEFPLVLTAAPAPLLLLFARRCARRESPRAVAGVAAATFLVLSGGQPEAALLVAVLAAAYVLASAPSPRGLASAVGGAAIGTGLAAPALLPFAEYFFRSAARAGVGRAPFVLGARDLLRFVSPRLPGSNVIEAAATVSVVVLLLLPVGFVAARRDRETRFWAFAAAAMVLAIYDNPISRGLALATPVYWTRFLLLLPLALGAVAAAGLDALRRRMASRTPVIARAIGAAAAGICLAELLLAARGVHAVTPAAWLAPRTPLLDRLAADRDVFRVLPLHTMLSPNSATDYGLDDVRGYDALGPAGWRRTRSGIGRFGDVPTQRDAIEPWDLAPGGAALDDWNVKYLLLPPTYGFGAQTLGERKGLDLEEAYAGPDGRILRNRRVRPRVRLEAAGGAPGGETRILSRAPGRWRIEARAEAAASLVVADPFFPGWKARVDGAPADVAAEPGEPLRVALAPGRHEVDLAYRPASFSAGVVIGASSVIALAALFARRRTG
ncbi:MAG TPA: hypothetical protein VIA45_14545 [Thermoanaerobaculia bacterium]